VKAHAALRWCLAAILIASAPHAWAQVPYVQAYFDYSPATGYGKTALYECRAPATFDTLTVVAHNVNQWINGVEFSLDIPPVLLYLDFVHSATLTIGSPPSGLALAWQVPQSAFGPFVIARVIVLWTAFCSCREGPQPIFVYGFPPNHNPMISQWPGYVAMAAVGMTSLVCADPPTTQSERRRGVRSRRCTSR
jgi:hypothetical protein